MFWVIGYNSWVDMNYNIMYLSHTLKGISIWLLLSESDYEWKIWMRKQKRQSDEDMGEQKSIQSV